MDLTQLTSPIEPAYQATLRRWRRHRLAERIWEGDPTVWSADTTTPELADRLGWLDLHRTMRPAVRDITRLGREVREEGIEHVVLCGMGGSSLAPEVFAAIVPHQGPELIVLDSTHPAAVSTVTDRVDPSRAVFVISSKSGTTLETLSFFRTFWAASGGDGSRFVAVTDPGTPLEELGEEREFRAVMNAPPDVGGRFSALTHFGLVPATLVGIEVERLLDSAQELAENAGRELPDAGGLALGIAWASLATTGRDKLTFLTSQGLAAFPAWMEQLLAESLGKEGAGIVPVADEPLAPPARYGPDRMFAAYLLAGEAEPDLSPLAGTGFPHVVTRLRDPFQIAAEMLRAEFATAAAGEVLGVHPFDQPDVEAAKRLAKQAMSGELDLGAVSTTAPDRATDAVDKALGRVGEDDYVAIHAYLPPSRSLGAALGELRVRIRERTGAATTLGWGPRFLHSTGQLHKGGPNRGVFIQLVDQPAADVPVPETDQTFGGIIAAQAAGDYQALVETGRRVERIDLGAEPEAVLARMLEALQ